MEIQLNIFQEIFLVSFSILYGVMLQNMMGQKKWQPFPWQQAHQERFWRYRLVCSILVQNALPFIYGISIFIFLERFSSEHFVYGLGDFQTWFLMFNVFWSSLGVFGFQRLYGFLAILTRKRKRRLFRELYIKMKKQNYGREPEWCPSLCSVIYYLASPISLIMSFCLAPVFGPVIGTFMILVLVVILVFLIPFLIKLN